MKNLVKRFIKYAKINTQSSEDEKNMPSNKNELELARIIANELETLGLKPEIDKHGYLYCKIPGNVEDAPPIGFISHLDTAPDAPGENVQPSIIEKYNGKDIVLNKKKHIVLKVEEFPCIQAYKGQDIIVTDGTTLLGADDKAGIAEIVTAIEYIISHPEIKHGDIMIAFTPDEEIGRGMDKFNIKKFNVDYAYTIDGEAIGSFEYENFNAATAQYKITGSSIHPGVAKNKMKNAIKIGMDLLSLLPCNKSPEFTSGYEGFFHIHNFNGTVDYAEIRLLIRSFFKEEFESMKSSIKENALFINKKYGKTTVRYELKDSYYNMKEIVDLYPEVARIPISVMKSVGIQPKVEPIRGGTDGARLSFMGIPTPNIFTGGHNAHSIFEYIPILSMEKAVEVIVGIIKEFTNFEKYAE